MAVEIDCPSVVVTSQGLRIRFPGGVEISALPPEITPSGIQVAKNLLGQANAAMMPLAPFFGLLDAVLAIKAVVDAIPDSIGPPPDPSALISALGELAPKIDRLLTLLPQLSVPVLIVDLLDVMISTLNGIIVQLEAIVAQELRIAAALLKAEEPGNGALLGAVQCANELNAATRTSLEEGIGPLNVLVGTTNVLLGLVPGAPTIPNLTDLPVDSQDAVDHLRAVVELLGQVRGAIPVP